MISRVADHCFWLGRYLERTESTSRALSVTRALSLDGELTPEQCWKPLVIVSGGEDAFVSRFGQEATGDGTCVQEYLAWDEQNPNSIVRTVAASRENARAIREVLTIEVWEAINELNLWFLSDQARSDYAERRHDFYRHVRLQIQLCLGLMRSTMLKDTPLDFIWLGVILERLGQTARMVDMHHHMLRSLPSNRAHSVVETALFLALLRACSGYEPFMKRYQGRVTAPAVASFLLLESRFPRSLRYCTHTAYERLCDIRSPNDIGAPGAQSLERLQALDEWLGGLRASDLERTAEAHEHLTRAVNETAAVCDLIRHEFMGI